MPFIPLRVNTNIFLLFDTFPSKLQLLLLLLLDFRILLQSESLHCYAAEDAAAVDATAFHCNPDVLKRDAIAPV